MRLFLIIIFTFVIISFVSADFSNGYVSGEGYTYNNGYWYYNNIPYARSLYRTNGYWNYGQYYPATYQYQYTQVVFKDKPAAKEESTPGPEWRKQLLEIASARDKWEADIRRGQFEQQYFLEGVKSLGLQGNFQWQGYGTPAQVRMQAYPQMPYTVTGNNYATTNFGANANTAYGYSYNSIAQLYGDTNLNQLYQQAAQLTTNAQRLAGDGNTQFQALIGEEGKNRARVAEILARGQMAHQIITALNSPSGTETRGFSFKFSSGGQIERTEEGVTKDTKAELFKKWEALAVEKCAACHNGQTIKGGFDITKYPSMSLKDKQEKVWPILVTPDDARVMPRPKAGETVKRLTVDEQRLFYLN